jgi:hypothetical protein
MKRVAFFCTALLLAGCVSSNFSRSSTPELYSALDTQRDGYTASLGSNASFEIVSTRTDGTRLCRVVNIDQPNRFVTESFCKVRGGEWR